MLIDVLRVHRVDVDVHMHDDAVDVLARDGGGCSECIHLIKESNEIGGTFALATLLELETNSNCCFSSREATRSQQICPCA